jgi:hypothetical protein
LPKNRRLLLLYESWPHSVHDLSPNPQQAASFAWILGHLREVRAEFAQSWMEARTSMKPLSANPHEHELLRRAIVAEEVRWQDLDPALRPRLLRRKERWNPLVGRIHLDLAIGVLTKAAEALQILSGQALSELSLFAFRVVDGTLAADTVRVQGVGGRVKFDGVVECREDAVPWVVEVVRSGDDSWQMRTYYKPVEESW